MKPGQLIKKYRDKSGLTQLQLAKQLGYSIPQFISLMENGHSKVPLNICNKLVHILKIPNKNMRDALLRECKNDINNHLLNKVK